jgi:hypothetical protein
MKRLISISITCLLLLSGMHLSVAMHFCGNEIEIVKVSVSGAFATCGMEEPDQSCSATDLSATSCCKNEISFFTVDYNYVPSDFYYTKISKNLFQTSYLPINDVLTASFYGNIVQSSDIPPGISFHNAVNLSEIRVYRI